MDKSSLKSIVMGLGLVMMTLMFSCKGSGASASSSNAGGSNQQLTAPQESMSDGNESKTTEGTNTGVSVKSPKNVSTESKLTPQKAPMKKTPTGGN